MHVEILALLGEMLLHRARYVGGVAQDNFAGLLRKFRVLAHGVRDDGEGELVMLRDPVNRSGLAPGASQVLGDREIDFRAERIVSQLTFPGVVGARFGPLVDPQRFRKRNIPVRFASRVWMLSRDGLLVASDSFSLVWARSVSGAEQCGSLLHRRLVLVVLVSTACAQNGLGFEHGLRGTYAAVASDDELGSSQVATALCRCMGGHRNDAWARADRFSVVSWSLTISVAGSDSDFLLHRRVWRVVPGCVVVSLFTCFVLRFWGEIAVSILIINHLATYIYFNCSHT